MPELPRNLNRRTSASNSASSVPGSMSEMKVRRTSVLGEDDRGGDLLAALEDDARGAAIADSDAGDAALGADLARRATGRHRRSRSLTPPVPPFGMPQARKAPSISPM